MDEYLFITLAKLKADRLKLEREQQAAAALAEPPAESPQYADQYAGKPTAAHSPRQSPKTRWFSRQPQWREQS
jgi:hypothetical protein